MTNTQLIVSSPSEAYRKLITSMELSKKFDALKSSYPLPAVFTSKDVHYQTKQILTDMFGV